MEKRDFNKDFLTYEDAYHKFKELISNGITIEELAYCYSLPIERINNILVRFDEVIDPVICKAIKKYYSKFKIEDDKTVIISDTHIGSHKEYLKLFDTIFNYCSKLGIKTIIHAGDLVEGNSYMPNRKDPIDIQVKKIKEIFNQNGIPKMFYLYGNHDYNLEIYDYIYLTEHLKELENIIYIGKGNSYISLNDNDPINICHTLSSDETYVPRIDTNLKLEGHHHFYTYFDNAIVHLPPLSLINGYNELGFVTLTTTGNEFILDVHKGLQNNIINLHDQKIIKKHL